MEEEEIRLFFLLFQARFTALEVIILAKELADMAVWTGARKIASATRSLLCGLAAHRSLMLPPPPSSPAQPPRTKWTMRVPREPALIMLRNNVGAVFIILFLNWFFPIYPRVKIFLIPASWLGTFHIIELGLLSVVFGFNILVALISLRYPRPPYPALKTPAKPPALTTPVKRPIKDLGTSFKSPFSASGNTFGSSGYASTPVSSQSRLINYTINSPLGSPLNFNQSGMSSFSVDSVNSSPLAAYRSRHPKRPSEPIGTRILDDLMAEDED